MLVHQYKLHQQHYKPTATKNATTTIDAIDGVHRDAASRPRRRRWQTSSSNISPSGRRVRRPSFTSVSRSQHHRPVAARSDSAIILPPWTSECFLGCPPRRRRLAPPIAFASVLTTPVLTEINDSGAGDATSQVSDDEERRCHFRSYQYAGPCLSRAAAQSAKNPRLYASRVYGARSFLRTRGEGDERGSVGSQLSAASSALPGSERPRPRLDRRGGGAGGACGRRRV